MTVSGFLGDDPPTHPGNDPNALSIRCSYVPEYANRMNGVRNIYE